MIINQGRCLGLKNSVEPKYTESTSVSVILLTFNFLGAISTLTHACKLCLSMIFCNSFPSSLVQYSEMEKFDRFYNPSLKDSIRPVGFFAVLKFSIYFDQLICDCGEDSYLEAQCLSYQHYLTLLSSYQAQ